MSDTVFWSWQDDLPARSNRAFIRDCLAAAVDRVSNALDVDEMERVDLDHNTKGTPGMADISQTILEKITGCAVMVADVTPIVRTEAGKALPNPNVMVELGFAMNAIRFDRIIAVLNTANGDRVETLPFDIRHRRILTYALAEDATKADRRAQRDALTSKLADAIAVNISQVRDERSASDEIVGAASDPGSDGLWNADWPIQHVGPFGARQKVSPVSVSRAWLRVIPAGFLRSQPLSNFPGTHAFGHREGLGTEAILDQADLASCLTGYRAKKMTAHGRPTTWPRSWRKRARSGCLMASPSIIERTLTGYPTRIC